MPDLLAAHGLTGCDTVAQCYGIGKGVALKVLLAVRRCILLVIWGMIAGHWKMS